MDRSNVGEELLDLIAIHQQDAGIPWVTTGLKLPTLHHPGDR
jgi:hypothetical protein